MSWRDLGAGEVRLGHVGERHTLAGWVARRRDHGGVTFIDLRDTSGVVQVVFREEDTAHDLRSEFCVRVTGEVRVRPAGNENPELPTGGVEVVATEIEVLKGEPVQKVYFENDAVRVFEVTFKPGDAAANIERPLRVIRVLKGGTLTLIYPDGKKEKLPWKTGEVKVRQPSPAYSPKNEGKSDIVLYVVYVKQAKK